ncbi:DUF1287 domain-containing protein [Novosphingobium sp. TH158]|uniref:DUF1287 domain-containing protein n=1 Tax=Novosphingobium sp. TH158 TaxID=2067455 RepID=UPI000C7A82BA|nr:DUF1287 domain-containing protein [Novosphingobium sp. TH158]PLK24262.1 DUF1287 domain-containing protein [Novosphingobium sp. TH158]
MPKPVDRRQVLAGGLAFGLAACTPDSVRAEPRAASPRARALIEAARRQIGVTLTYDPAYTVLAYPGGDVPRIKGVCTDVVIRAYRDALGIDLQAEVHRDMASAFSAYPRRWGLNRPDRSIDHRRVPNLERFWDRAGARQPLADWQPGDVFSSLVGGRLPHTGVVSDRLSPHGQPLVIHNMGQGTQEEELASAGRMIGRFRWKV